MLGWFGGKQDSPAVELKDVKETPSEMQLPEKISSLEKRPNEAKPEEEASSEPAVVEAATPEAPAAATSSADAPRISELLVLLRADFEKKFASDAQYKELTNKLHEELQHKNDLINKLHEELQKYKADMIWKLTKPLFMGIITLGNQLKEEVQYFKEKDGLSPDEMLKAFASVPDMLDEILSRQGVTSFTPEAGEQFSPLKHKAKKPHMQIKIKDLDKTVYETIHSGYEIDGRVLTEAVVRAQLFIEQPAVGQASATTSTAEADADAVPTG